MKRVNAANNNQTSGNTSSSSVGGIDLPEWIFEVDEDDDIDIQTSILQELDIDPKQIFKKTVKVGQLELSPIGCGTWSWGNRFLWQYSKSNDILLKDTFNYVISNGINWFDTADSYGTSDLTGRAEELLGPRGILFREFLPSIQPLLNELRSIAKFRNKTVPQVALNWVMQKGFLVLVGIRSIEQAKDNLGAVGWALSDAEVDSLDIIANRNNNQLIQNSFQSN
eukprot:gene20702-26838_t